LELIAGSELGEYRPSASLDAGAVSPPSKPGDVADEPVVVARTEALATIHRATRMMSLAVRIESDADGSVIEHRFIGLLGSGAYRESVFAIPVLRDRATEVLKLSGATAVSHTGRAIKNVVDTLPRDLLFELGGHMLAELVIDIVGLQERRIVRVFDVAEPVGEFTTVFVYLPKARFESGLQERVAALVARHAGGEVRDVSSLVESSSLARISMTVSRSSPLDLDRLGEQIDRETASWRDRSRAALIDALGEQTGRKVDELVRDVVPRSYSSRVDPAAAVGDLAKIARLMESSNGADAEEDGGAVGDQIETSLSRSVDGPAGEWRFRIFRRGAGILRQI